MSRLPVVAGEAILPVRCMVRIKTHAVRPYRNPCLTRAFALYP